MASKWQPFKQINLMDYLPPHLRKRIRDVFIYSEAMGIEQKDQSPLPNQKFREPAPVSQPRAHIPFVDKKEDIYNIQFYTRDIAHTPDDVFIGRHPALDYDEIPKLPENMGSPGNNNPAVLAYDPTGTRSAMSTTHAAVNELLKEHESTHMVRYEWEAEADDIIKEYESKSLPPVPGRPVPWDLPPESRQQRW